MNEENTYCHEKSYQTGFSVVLDELIEDGGEAAFVIEQDENLTKFVGYTLPRKGMEFKDGEVRNAFLAQTMMNSKFEDEERQLLSCYLDNATIGKENVENEKKSVFKYKPVAIKTRPVIGELPAEFRIKREIRGDPLKEMPKLSTNPPDFEPTGRYALERKEKIDKVHKEEFLLPEERKLAHQFMMLQNQGFAWDDTERGRFREDFFPLIDIPVEPHCYDTLSITENVWKSTESCGRIYEGTK